MDIVNLMRQGDFSLTSEKDIRDNNPIHVQASIDLCLHKFSFEELLESISQMTWTKKIRFLGKQWSGKSDKAIQNNFCVLTADAQYSSGHEEENRMKEIEKRNKLYDHLRGLLWLTQGDPVLLLSIYQSAAEYYSSNQVSKVNIQIF